MKLVRCGSGWLAGLLAVLLATGAQAQSKPSILLYDGSSASGAYVQVEGEVKNLSDTGFDNRSSSVFVVRGSWQLCTNANFQGDCKTLGQGLHELGTLADKVSSLRPVDSTSGGSTGEDLNAVVVFLERGGGGKSLRTTTNIPSLASHAGFADAISSIAIFKGNWEFCNKASYKGTCITLGPGVYNLENLNDAIDSLRKR
jgi:hypothetical protein